MDLEQAIIGRRSVREYTQKPVEDETINHLIGAAILAPSAVNAQPWTFTIVRDQALLSDISTSAKSHMLSAATKPDGDHFAALHDENFHIFYHAPVLIVISGNAAGPWIAEDCAIAAENLMLTAYTLGLGTCWIGFSQSYLNTEEGKKKLGIPMTWVPIAPIIVGYPKTAVPTVPRKAPIIHRVR